MKRKIFVVAMIGFFILVFSAYLLSLSRTVAYAVHEEQRREGGLGEFHLPELKDGVGAAVKDIMRSFE